MKRTFLKVALLSSLMLSMPVAFTSCKDYDEDIKNLQDKDGNLESQLSTLKASLESLNGEVAAAKQAAAEAKEAAAKAQAAADEKMTEAATKKLAEEIAKQAAAQAKADAVSEAIAQVNELLKGYATKEELGEVAAKIAGISDNLNTLTNDFNEVKALQQQMKVQLDALEKYEEYGTQIGVMQKDIEAVKGDITKIQQALENCVTADQMKKAIDEVSASLAKKNAAVITLLTGMLRSMVFIPEAYVDGIETAIYDYLQYNPLTFTKPSNWSAASQLGPNKTVVTTDGAVYGYDNWSKKLDSKKKEVVVYDFQPRTLSFDLNPATAKFNVNQIDLKGRFVQAIDTRAELPMPKINIDRNATTPNENGVMTVAYTMDNAQYLEQLRNASTNGGSVYMAQAVVSPEENDTTGNGGITSDAAQIYGLSMTVADIRYNDSENVVEQWKKDQIWGMNDYWKNVAPSLKQDAPTVAGYMDLDNVLIPYNGSLDLNSVLTVSFTNNQVISYEEMKAFGLSFEYTKIDYAWGYNETSESAYCKLAGSVVTPCGVTPDGKPSGAPNKSSINKEPLIFVKLMHGEDVLKVGYVKIQIVEKLTPAPVPVDKIVLNDVYFTCEPNTADATWSQISSILLGAIDGGAGMSKQQFFMNYGMVFGQYGAVQYTYNEKTGKYEPIALKDYIGQIGYGADYSAPASNVIIKWIFDPAEAQMAYDLENHTVTTYVAFARKDNEGNIDENTAVKYYVPLQTKIVKPLGTVVNKVAEMWMRDNTTTLVTTPVPLKNNANDVSEYNISLDEAWYHTNKQGVQVAGPVLDGISDKFIELGLTNFTLGASNANGYKYYFAAASDQTVTMPIDGKDMKVVFKASSAGKSTDFNTPVVANDVLNTKNGVTVNADNQLAYGLTIESTPNASVYDNTTLYAAIMATNANVSKTTVFTPIATIDQSTGVVSYEYNDVAKKVLNAYPSRESAGTDKDNTRACAKLNFQVGVVFYGPCGLIVPLTNGEYPSVFLRPLNVYGVAKKEFAGNKPGGSSLNVKDLISMYDWTGTAINKTNDWLYTWYGIESFTVDLANIQSNAADPKVFAVNEAINSRFSADKVSTTPVIATTWAKFDNAATLGTITYNGGQTVTNGFEVKIPVTVEYYWGKIYVLVSAKVNAMAQ